MNSVAERLRAALADRYRIERELGAGGMATVYLAEDLKHARQVAIKVLKPELAAVLGGERFVQEITTTAQLQHPHILPLFDSGTADGFLFYVMPYVEGETLREKLDRETQLGVDEAVRIAREVADALDYAHRHGVIHRDIKPENILLHDGRPVVADFGIALAVSAAAGGRMTETGTSLGTPHYMSPEQATADKDITGRSDIYSLASVLYEMLAGEPPHSGGSAQAVIMKIIADQARPVSELRRSVPPNVTAALSQALEKLPADRFESAKAFSDALADPGFRRAGDAGAGTGPGHATRSRGRDPVFLGIAAVAILALAGLLWSLSSGGASTAEPTVYDVALVDGAPMAVTGEQGFAVAPSGDFVVYQAQEATGSALWYRSLRDATNRRIDGTDGAERPAISPDGTRVAFLRVRDRPKWTLEVVPIEGGATTTLGNGTGATNVQWLDDGRIQLVEGDGNHMRWIDPGGGPTVEQQVQYCITPFHLPDPDRFLCGGGGRKWAAVMELRDTTTGATTWLWTDAPDSTLVYGSHFRVIDERYLVYLSMGGDLLAAPVDLAEGRVGRSVRLVTGVDRSAYFGAGSYAVSRSGTLVHAPGPNRAVGALVATDGVSYDTLNVERGAFNLFAVSPDGRRLATVAAGLEGEELRVYDLDSGEHLTMMRRPKIRQPVWSPQGDRLVFSVDDSVFLANPDQVGSPELIYAAPGTFEVFTWLSDGRLIGGHWDDFTGLSLDPSTTPTAVDTLATDASFVTMSPDGRWLAYCNPALNTLWLAPVAGGRERYQVATGELEAPLWRSPDELVYESYTDPVSIVRVGIEAGDGSPRLTRTTWLALPDFQDTAGQSAALTPDGRVLYKRGVASEPIRYLRVVPDWVAQMERAVDEANR